MKKIDVKKDELEFLKRNWETLRESTLSVMNETADFLMTTVEKDIDMVVERANKTVLKVNSWLKGRQERMHEMYHQKEAELEKELEMDRMADEGGAGFINTMPHETSPTETSSAAARPQAQA